MPRWRVEQCTTIVIVHVIEAPTSGEAKGLMAGDTTKGLIDILEDDSEVEYEVEPFYPCEEHEHYDDSCNDCYELQYGKG